MANMVFTTAGLTAASKARSGGPMITVVGYSLGSAYNYTPDPADTALHGTKLYPATGYGPISGYFTTLNSEGKVVANFSIIVDDSVGNFSFGEIALHMSDGSIIGLHAYEYLQTKIQSTADTAGNTIELLVRLVLDTDTTPIIDFTTITGTTARRAVLSKADLATPPSAAGTNTLRVSSLDEFGRAVVLDEATTSRWYSPNFDLPIVKSGVVSSGSVYSLISSQLNGVLNSSSPGVANGRYLLVFNTGALAGRVREITPIPTWAAGTFIEQNQYVRTADGTRQFRASVAGTTGGTQPTWPAYGTGSTIVDGGVTWVESTYQNANNVTWATSTGTAPSAGDTFTLYRATSFEQIDRLILEFHLRRRGNHHFNAHH